MENSKKQDKKRTAESIKFNKSQSRRDFLKTTAKIALPTIAFLGFGSLGNNLFGLNKEPARKAKLSTTCENSCEGECDEMCAGGCAYDCESTCTGNCSGSCEGLCEGQCEGKSGPSVNKSNKSLEETSCDCTGCTGSCLGPCKGDCISGCHVACAGVCKGNSQGVPGCSLRG